jgi:hypothetical protein
MTAPPTEQRRSQPLDRRKFLARCGRWSVAVLLGSIGYHLGRAEEGLDEFTSPGFPRPPLPGACLEPVGTLEKTLAAVVDTVVPGTTTDPEGHPGALESCALNLLLDDFYPFRSYASLIVSLVDAIGQQLHASTFLDADYQQRLEVLIKAQEDLPVLRLAYRAIRSAFYGGAYNGIGLDFVGYPGPNLGYRHLPEASFRLPVCKELTEDGWMP